MLLKNQAVRWGNGREKLHPCYSQKLAAAIRSWEAVASEPMYKNNGKSVKQNLQNWLESHAAEYGLLKVDGEIYHDAIEGQISKVANWEEKGGAPKTRVKTK